ncbi:TetR/AcrR family transcriptional regulator, lmrAB and yxaGH operons repressor [Marmoricola sp. URHA0025 HA25]
MGATTDTRARMINSAALLLREHGVAGTSIARVLEHSRGPRGSVQFHFPGGKAQLLTEALAWAGGLISKVLSQAQARGDTPADVVNAICEHYKRQLASSDFRAGCPVGAVAQEAFAEPKLGTSVAGVLDDWVSGLRAVLVTAGHDQTEAYDLAVLCVSSIEGAITLARVQRSTRPIQIVQERLIPLL